MRIAILDDIHQAYAHTQGVQRLREHAQVQVFTGPFGAPAALRGFDALVANRERTRFTAELFAQLPDLRILAQTGNHAYHIDLAAAAAQGVVVAKASGGYSTGAAELAIALALALMRQIPAQDAAVKRGEWRTPRTEVLNGKVMGVVGMGHVGRHVARVARALDMRVLAYSPRLDDATAAAQGVQRAELDELLQQADVVSVHLTLSPQSRGLIGAARLALMKPGAYLINTARGPIVDEPALIAALSEGRIAGAGLDVFDAEPLPAGHALTKLPNVILTPHLGWPTDQAYERFAGAVADVLLDHLAGREVPRFVQGH